MWNDLLKKGLVFSILFLFFSASIELNINVGAEIFDTVSVINRNEYCNSLCRGDTLEEEWNITFGGTDYDEGYSVQQTSDGGYIITGCTLSFGAGNWDVWLIKIDSNGFEEWNQTFGGINYDSGYSVQQTSDDGYVITGCTYSFGAGNWDVWLIKTDFSGFEEWNQTFGGLSDDWGYSVQQTSDDGYTITGYTDSYGAGDSDVWLIKTNSVGIEEWNQTFGGVSYDRGRSVQQTSDGGYIITGYTVSYDADDTGCDVWLIKTDSNGNKEWHQTFGGNDIPNKFDMGYSVEQTDDGGYIITGDTEIYFVAMSDVLLIKTDSNGNEEWYQTFGGNSSDRGRSVQQTKDGGYIISGWATSYSVTDPDVWLIKTDSSGKEDWNYTFGFGENSGDWGYSVQQTNDNGYIITGATMPGGWMILESPTSYTVEGTNVWLIKIAGENHPPNPPIITGPTNGRIWVVYQYNFSIFDPDGDSMHIRIDWEYGTPSKWDGPFPSDSIIKYNYSWRKKGTYTIRAQTMDSNGLESEWGTLTVTMPRNKIVTSPLFQRFLEQFPILREVILRLINL